MEVSKMKLYYLTVLSKNLKSLTSFFKFLYKFFKVLDISAVKKYLRRKNTKQVFTILKSPHVNKTAQEQFESRKYRKNIIVYPLNSPADKVKLLLFFKKLKNSCFSGIKLNLSYIKIDRNVLLSNHKMKINSSDEFYCSFKNVCLHEARKNKIRAYHKRRAIRYEDAASFCTYLDIVGELKFFE